MTGQRRRYSGLALKQYSNILLYCVVASACLSSASVWAQTAPVPDAGSILRDTERSTVPRAPDLSPFARPEAPLEPAPDEVTFLVERFDVRGVTLVPLAEVQKRLKPWLNRELTFADLELALNAIAELYQERGWYARPQLPAQDVIDNTIIINVIEGRMGSVLFPEEADSFPIASSRLSDYITAHQETGDYLNMDSLNRSIRLLNELPGITTQVAMAPSEEPGASDLVVWAEASHRLNASLMVDNSGSRSTGRERAFISGNWNNPAGIGDQVTLALLGSKGVRYGRLGYELPVGHQGLKLNAGLSSLNYRIVRGEQKDLKLRGDAHTATLGASYPWLRSATQNRNLRLTLEQADYDNEADGNTTSRKRVQSLVLGVNGDLSDSHFGGGFTLWGLDLTQGDLKLKDAASAEQDSSGPRAAGSFTKLNGNLARLQRITDSTTLWASFNGQWAGGNLDSGQKFSLGGANGVRAYPTSEGSGDHGWLATLELRHTLNPQWQINAFYDHGWVQENKNAGFVASDSTRSNRYSLRGAGIGVNYSLHSNIRLQASWAHKLGNNPNAIDGNDGDGTDHDSRFWLQLVMSL